MKKQGYIKSFLEFVIVVAIGLVLNYFLGIAIDFVLYKYQEIGMVIDGVIGIAFVIVTLKIFKDKLNSSIMEKILKYYIFLFLPFYTEMCMLGEMM